jgi:predicted RNase H-like nuclease (RuvC/YqgF family)
VESELQRLRSSTSRAASSEQAAVERRITTVESENRQLRESLAEAEAKIEALSSIERSIREQSGNGDPQ